MEKIRRDQISANEAEIVIRRIFIDLDARKKTFQGLSTTLTGNFSSSACATARNPISEEGRKFYD